PVDFRYGGMLRRSAWRTSCRHPSSLLVLSGFFDDSKTHLARPDGLIQNAPIQLIADELLQYRDVLQVTPEDDGPDYFGRRRCARKLLFFLLLHFLLRSRYAGLMPRTAIGES